jgi:uncharacterized membrane protein YhaH (DUF805 family)
MSLINSLITLLFSFDGRLGRKGYVFATVVGAGIILPLVELIEQRSTLFDSWAFKILVVLWILVACWILAAAGLKRLRDIGLGADGLVLLFVCFPLVALFLSLCPKDSTAARRRARG